MSSASKVGELFKAAGQAFSQLGDQALQVHSLSEWQHSSGLSGRGRGRKRVRSDSATTPTESPPKLHVSARNYVPQNAASHAEIPSTQSLLTVDTLRSSDDIELAEKLRIEQALNDL